MINFNKGYDWLILARFMREQMHAVTTFTRLENIVLFGVLVELVGKLLGKTNKKPSLSSVVF